VVLGGKSAQQRDDMMKAMMDRNLPPAPSVAQKPKSPKAAAVTAKF
jgi:D-alanyl-D-alanine carboxypeptidase